MTRRQSPWPTCWLMTDERLGVGLWQALEQLPRGAGVVVRHYALSRGERLRLARLIARLARRRRLTVAVAGDERLARQAGASLVHNPPGRRSPLARSFAVHSLRDLRIRRRDAAALFLSPLHATRSHPGAAPLGRMRAATLVRLAGAVPVYALGGMTARRFAALRPLGFAGWAAIDAWDDRTDDPPATRDQNLKAVPT